MKTSVSETTSMYLIAPHRVLCKLIRRQLAFLKTPDAPAGLFPPRARPPQGTKKDRPDEWPTAPTQWRGLAERAFIFANEAKMRFEGGSLEEKPEILGIVDAVRTFFVTAPDTIPWPGFCLSNESRIARARRAA